jgi:hypothetical protein
MLKINIIKELLLRNIVTNKYGNTSLKMLIQ